MLSATLARLNLATHGLHPYADAPWLRLLAADVTQERYLEHLITVYGFESAVEAALSVTPHIGGAIQLRERARSGLIVEDLLSLGFTPQRIAHLPHCSSIVSFLDIPEAMGWMYVVERATLLHDATRQQLIARFGAPPCEYLSAYAGLVAARWQSFGEALDRVAQSPAVTEQIISAARAAFDCQQQWHSQPAVAC